MMDLIYTVVAGLIFGLIAGKIMPGDEPGGIWGTLAFGVIGSFLGKFVLGMLGNEDPGMIMNLIGSVAGACLLIFLWKKFIAPMMGGNNGGTAA